MINSKFLISLIGLFFSFYTFASDQPTTYSSVKTQFVQVKDLRFAYRTYGKKSEVPLVLLMHTRGNMDNWDPALLDILSKSRTVITFDSKGVGLTKGTAPFEFETMADDAADFIESLGYKKVDILGFSIGGAVAQELMIRHASLVRRAILAGTSAKGGDGVNAMSQQSKSVSTKEKITDDDLLYNFFATTSSSVKLGKDFIARLKLRTVDKDPPVSMETVKAQAIARESWGKPDAGYENRIRQVGIPILIANGKEDIRMPTLNSYKLFLVVPHAQLDLYPDSGHGFLFQYPSLVGTHFNTFLSQEEEFGYNSESKK